jgi:NADPH:quinone reductase-like Zn-dependent oxidoreductase
VESLRPDVGRDRPHLERIVELFEAGAVTVPEISLYPLSEAEEAHRVSEGRHLRGKLIFKVR